jgi:hypothetical protein
MFSLLLCRYESRRILLRQGHQPTAFYLLLTGSLMVNIKDVHPSTGHVFIRTVSDLKEGDCFGVSLLNLAIFFKVVGLAKIGRRILKRTSSI